MKVFKITIDESDMLGMSCISLVEQPAVETDFLAFSKEEDFKEVQKMKYSMDDDKHIVTGVVAVADKPILRFNAQLGYHYVVFDRDVISKMVHRYFKNGYSNNVNIEHDGPYVKGVTLFESYIKDSERGITPVEFSDVPDGSWLVSYKVEDEVLWDEIKNGSSLKGFSLEGYFQYGEELKESYEDWIDNFINNNKE